MRRFNHPSGLRLHQMMTLLFILHSISGFNSGLEVPVLPGSPTLKAFS